MDLHRETVRGLLSVPGLRGCVACDDGKNSESVNFQTQKLRFNCGEVRAKLR